MHERVVGNTQQRQMLSHRHLGIELFIGVESFPPGLERLECREADYFVIEHGGDAGLHHFEAWRRRVGAGELRCQPIHRCAVLLFKFGVTGFCRRCCWHLLEEMPNRQRNLCHGVRIAATYESLSCQHRLRVHFLRDAAAGFDSDKRMTHGAVPRIGEEDDPMLSVTAEIPRILAPRHWRARRPRSKDSGIDRRRTRPSGRRR